MTITESVIKSEKKFIVILEMFFKYHWGNTFLISHGLDHHRRVWSYAKELLSGCEGRVDITDPFFTDKLVIACYLHDLGISAESGINHGKQSRILCQRFLRENNLPESVYHDLLEAVENHDRKDYEKTSVHIDLFSLLCVSDDLDAFGFTGIYRYIEICLERGIRSEEMGKLVSENVARRFRNFISTFGFSRDLILRHKKRYQVVDLFFNELSREDEDRGTSSDRPGGYNGVIRFIRIALNDKTLLSEVISNVLREEDDEVVRWFFANLKKEVFIS
jgi:hypothetical protein